MNKGPKLSKACPGAKIKIMASGPFTCYAMDKGKRTLILGPLSYNARNLNAQLPWDIDQVYVKCEKSTEWTLEWSRQPFPKSIPDKTPIEIGIVDQPLSIHEEMRRFIREEVSRNAQEHGQTSFEEEDDFDIEDPDEIYSPYEMSDMQEDYIGEVTTIPAKTEPAAPVAEPQAAPMEKPKEPEPTGASPSQDTPLV